MLQYVVEKIRKIHDIKSTKKFLVNFDHALESVLPLCFLVQAPGLVFLPVLALTGPTAVPK